MNQTTSQPVTDWQPTSAVSAIWMVLGTVLIGVGLAIFSGLAAWRGSGEASVSITGLGLVLSLVAVAALLVLHELIHGGAIRRYGARPTYGAGAFGKLMPYFYCTAAGFRFTRRQFVVISLAPAVLVSVAGALTIALVGHAADWLILALAMHLGGCIGDFWGTVLTLRHPPGTMIEDIKTGIRFFPPSPAARPTA